MGHIFGESEHRARKDHFCYFCCNNIEKGQIYRRWCWVAESGHFHVMREHSVPFCPPNEAEEYVREEMRAERAALGEPIRVEARAVQVLKLALNGDTLVETELQFVPVVCEAEKAPLYSSDDDPDIPF